MRRVPPLFAIVLLACSSLPSDETPSGALRLFLDAMERSNTDETALREAYGLLSASSQRALSQRAHEANSVAARARGPDGRWRPFEPWEMLVQGRFRLNFTPAHGQAGMREHIDGERARVHVVSQDGARTANVDLVRENARWRVVLEITPSETRR